MPKIWTREENETIRHLFILGWSKQRLARAFKVNDDQMAGKLTHLNLRRKLYPVQHDEPHDVVVAITNPSA